MAARSITMGDMVGAGQATTTLNQSNAKCGSPIGVQWPATSPAGRERKLQRGAPRQTEAYFSVSVPVGAPSLTFPVRWLFR
jgi:hypothetical protein